MKSLLVFSLIFCLFAAVSEMDYRDQLNAPAAADYQHMKCDYFPDDPDCKAKKQPKVAQLETTPLQGEPNAN